MMPTAMALFIRLTKHFLGKYDPQEYSNVIR